MNDSRRLRQNFQESAELQLETLALLSPAIESAGAMLSQALCQEAKILCCGNGGSAAQSQHFASELVNRFERERPGLPAINLAGDSATLTSIANDYHFETVFARQIHALGRRGDILVIFTTSGLSANIIQAARLARDKDLAIIALSGKDGGQLAQILGNQDLELRVPSHSTPRIQELHLLIAHCLCDLVDFHLFGE